jgi:hypothetical protein
MSCLEAITAARYTPFRTVVNSPRTLNSAPQTVLKTAGWASATVQHHPHPPKTNDQDSAGVRQHPRSTADLAVILAVI